MENNNNVMAVSANNGMSATFLTREEMAIYMNYYSELIKNTVGNIANVSKEHMKELTNIQAEFSSNTKQFADDMKNMYDNFTNNVTSIISAQSNQQAQLLEAFNNLIESIASDKILNVNKIPEATKVDNTNIFYSSKTEQQMSKWVSTAMENAGRLAAKSGNRRSILLANIYSDMSDALSKEGFDFKEMYNKWKSSHANHSKIGMIGTSDKMRKLFENKYYEYSNSYATNGILRLKDTRTSTVNVHTEDKSGRNYPPSAMAVLVPDSINSIISKLKGDAVKNDHGLLKRIYSRMKLNHDVDLDKCRADYCKSSGYKNCSYATAIANNEEYMGYFVEAVIELAKEI